MNLSIEKGKIYFFPKNCRIEKAAENTVYIYSQEKTPYMGYYVKRDMTDPVRPRDQIIGRRVGEKVFLPEDRRFGAKYIPEKDYRRVELHEGGVLVDYE